MDWLLLAGLGIMWTAFLVPSRLRPESRSVQDFERRLELLANAEVHGTSGRWIVTPRKGVRFLGPKERNRARARERRRRVLVILLESLTLTFLIGIVPPLRALWSVSLFFGVLLVLYVWLLLSLKARAPHPHEQARAARAEGRTTVRIGERYVADGRSAWARHTFNGLGSVGEGDRVHVVVKPASAGA